MATSHAIPSPNFSVQVSDSALRQKANLWTSVLNERAQLYGGTARKQRQQDGDWPGAKKKLRTQLDKSSSDYYCDACDRAFKNYDQFSVHTSEHEQCQVKGCTYVAAPKLVKLHYNMQHVTGLADKIKESSADIQKWIEERKRNFPTAANIQRKQEELRAKQERGEVLETKQFGRMGRGRRGRGGRGHGGRGRGRGGQSSHIHQNCNSSLQMSTSNQPVRDHVDTSDPLSNIASAQMGQSLTPTYTPRTPSVGSSQNTLPIAFSQPPHSSTVPTSLGGLSSLLSSYGDLSSEEEGEIRDSPQPSQSQVSAVPPNSQSSVSCAASTSQSAESSAASTSHSAESGAASTSQSAESKVPPTTEQAGSEAVDAGPRKKRKNRNKSTIKGQRQQQNRNINRSRSSLLEKLLANEIRHERNVLLQCVRHVVKGGFFGAGQKEKTTSETTYIDDDVW